MKTEQIIKTLQEHNDWRRGVGKWTDSEKANYFDTISAYELGQTIDAAIERLQELEQNYAEMELEFRKHIVKLEREQDYWKKEAAIFQDREKYYDITIEQLEKERDEARNEATLYRNACYALNDKDCELLPWEKGNK